MRILNFIIELLTCPFTFFMRTNVTSINLSKWTKPLIVLFISLGVIVILVLFFYRTYIFK